MNRKVGTVMTRNPICVGTDTEVLDAIKTMNKHRISCLPVLEKGTRRLQGIVTWKDIVRAFCPEAFDSPSDSHRLKTGVHINPESRESQRLRAKSAESVRLRAVQSGRNEPPAPAQPQPRSHGTPGIDADRITATPPTQEKLPPRPMDGPAERPGLNPPFDSDRSV
ncbi:MAG: CBS domain-containing protein [Planctomycetes bacterium]|nr:CBS domain-containing protein [Planctomycetota bacterium]